MKTLTVVFEEDNDYLEVYSALKQYQIDIENKTKEYIPMETLAGKMLYDCLIDDNICTPDGGNNE